MAELETESYWAASSSMSRYPALDRDLTVDVAIVGAGITGLTAAYLLTRAGRRVAVIDRARCGGVDTGLTTAHVTCVTDVALSQLVKTFGRDGAWAAWDAGLAAIELIDRIISREEIECEWTWVTAYKHASIEGAPDPDALRNDAALASELGFDATFCDHAPVLGLPGIAYGGQAKFHPRKYLAALAAFIDGSGSH
ncbi:MAG TPA: FAD-binding oxidoreductase, partial [Vicinamibacterales bacterium]